MKKTRDEYVTKEPLAATFTLNDPAYVLALSISRSVHKDSILEKKHLDTSCGLYVRVRPVTFQNKCDCRLDNLFISLPETGHSPNSAISTLRSIGHGARMAAIKKCRLSCRFLR